jgi:hypothetical protein
VADKDDKKAGLVLLRIPLLILAALTVMVIIGVVIYSRA